MKTCADCARTLSTNDFTKNSSAKDGLSRRCRTCQRIYENEKIAARAKRTEPVTEKTCRSCHVTKAASEFPRKKSNLDGLYSWCRACVSEKNRSTLERRLAGDLPSVSAGQKKCGSCGGTFPDSDFYRSSKTPDGLAWACRPCTRLGARARLYGVTADWLTETFSSQEGACAICRDPLKDIDTAHVDHCHETQRPRGLLCPTCNKGLGHFRDSVEYLEAAIDYLRLYS